MNILSFLTYTIIISYTPGPANFLSLSVSSHYGFKQFLKVWAGLFTAYLLDLFFAATLSFSFSQLIPKITNLFTFTGFFYILWLAWHIFKNTPTEQISQPKKKAPGFFTGFLLNLTNIKIILYAFTVYQIYLMPNFPSLPQCLLLAFPIGMISSSSCLFWALGGRVLSCVFEKHYRLCNTIMTLLLIWCAIKIII